MDNGENCNYQTGYMCATSDKINLISVSYCLTNDNLECISDNGTFCNS